MTLDLGRDVPLVRTSFSREGGFYVESTWGRIVPESAQLEMSYKRDRKPKVLGRIPLDVRSLAPDPDLALLRYHRVFAVDTNRRLVKGERVSATAIVLAEPVSAIHPPFVRYAIRHALEHHQVDCDAERLGWKHVVQGVLRNPAIQLGHRIGLLVDSNLDALERLNRRLDPILDDLYLPQRFELLYASADSGQEFLVNRLMREADRAADGLLRMLESSDDRMLGSLQYCGEHATHVRSWDYDG